MQTIEFSFFKCSMCKPPHFTTYVSLGRHLMLRLNWWSLSLGVGLSGQLSDRFYQSFSNFLDYCWQSLITISFENLFWQKFLIPCPIYHETVWLYFRIHIGHQYFDNFVNRQMTSQLYLRFEEHSLGLAYICSLMSKLSQFNIPIGLQA